MSDIKQGMFVGSAGMMQADGVQKAIEVHIFPESMRKKEEVQPGTKIFVAAAKKQPDGTVQAPRVAYGRNGQALAF
jgi:hypothetical protein